MILLLSAGGEETLVQEDWTLEYFLNFKASKTKSFTEWPSLKILNLCRQLQISCEMSFSVSLPLLTS